MAKLLIIDDNEDIRKQLKWGFSKEFEVLLAADRHEAIATFRKHHPKVVTLDLGLPPHEDGVEEGFRCLEELLSISPLTKVIVITGNDDKGNAFKAVKTGAYDFFQKPIDINELRIIISRAFHLLSIEEENSRLQDALETKGGGIGGIIGQCPEMQQIFSTVRKIATSDVPIFITGESGTGKEMVARAVHGLSLRASGPFIPINCGAIPENLLESELFGHEKGAFTGAQGRVQGKVEYAHRGTLFLDEIGELPAPLQVKILRFLQEKMIQRVGGREDIIVDARIISATNIDIVKAIREGVFREDLFYRTAVINIKIPPLRERGEDLAMLANFFLKRFSEQFNRRVKGFNQSALETMRNYDWPGNVRELENRIQRAVLMAEAPLLDMTDLGFTEPIQRYENLGEKMTLRDAKERIEREMIHSALKLHQWNITKVADELGISRPTLYDLMKKHGIEQS